MFRVCFSDPDQGAASATYIAENKLAEKIAVIYDSSDVYSSGIYEKFAAEAANQGLEIVDAEAFSHLPCGNASELRLGTAKAYVLRG